MSNYPDWPNLPTMMFSRAREWGDRPLFRFHREGAWHGVTWGAFARRAASVARGLRAAGVAAGDRVLIASESRPEVPIVETALMAIRAVPVPAYATNTPEDHAHLLLDSGARVAVASSVALAERVHAGAAHVGGLDTLFCMEGDRFRPFAALEADMAGPEDVAAEAELIPRGALACLMYTSGTSGRPRGVMLAHRCILSNCRGAAALVRPLRLRNEVYLSFLPISHSYEHTVGQFFLPSLGTEIVYSRGVEHLVADFAVVKPTIMTVVPRILEVIRARILGQVRRETRLRQGLFEWALAAGLRRLDGRPTVLDRLADPVLDRLVRAKVRDRFGGRFRAAMSGGARLDPEVGRFFLAMGMTIMQGYGQTEAGPVITANPPERPKIETVGVPLEGVELRIAGDGEILVRGELVMDGYWRDPEATAAAIVNGWLHTGDVGVLDADGYLTITDRKKDIIVLSGGENVSPARVEGALMGEREIAQAVVYGDGQAGLSALLVPAEGEDARTVADAVARVNRGLAVTERVRHHRLVPPFTVENGLLTPSQKIRRGLVLRAHLQGVGV
ncbi:MAG TPA: AMP-dependent synthetase/ligase [Acetobacteraceae bacterium]|nr:AMP-dependent synthetase/ligase [Acetobacteraceae bacterium]